MGLWGKCVGLVCNGHRFMGHRGICPSFVWHVHHIPFISVACPAYSPWLSLGLSRLVLCPHTTERFLLLYGKVISFQHVWERETPTSFYPQLIRFLQIQSEKPTSAAAAKFSKRNLFWLVKSHLISQPNNLLVSQASYWLICSEIFSDRQFSSLGWRHLMSKWL